MSKTDTEETRIEFSQKRTEEIGELYKPKIMAILTEIHKEALSRGFTCDEPFEMTDEVYRFCMLLKPPGMPGDAEDGVDVTIQIPESYVYGDAAPECKDAEDNRNGLNFALDLCEYGGTIVGGVTPYNYSPQCWVDISDLDAVKDRWDIFTGAFDATLVVETILEHYANEAVKEAG